MSSSDFPGPSGPPLLTIVTVCLNRADTIGAALDSVVRQNASDLEHLVIDGASTDGTCDIVRRYPGVRLVSERDSGLYDAMNKGIRLASGSYVCFLNSDDLLADGIVDAVRPFMLAGHDVVCTGAEFVRGDSNGPVIERIVAPEAIRLSAKTVTLGSPLLNAKFMRRDFLLEKVGPFNPLYRLASDVEMLLRAALAEPSQVVVPVVGCRYIEHAGSLTINPSGNNGFRAAEECLAIADATLALPRLSWHTRFILHALRGGKVWAIAQRARHNAAEQSSRRPLQYGCTIDIACYLAYLAHRRLKIWAAPLLGLVHGRHK
jgi:glycosyltransferase involved in cell wall biosynthesis